MSEAVDEPDEVMAVIRTAKEFLLKAFQDEKIESLGLEEVRRNKHDDTWKITLGFSRRWEAPPPNNTFLAMAATAAAARLPRTYKVVTIDSHGPKGLSITNRADD